MKSKTNKSNHSGFTLIEILIAIVIFSVGLLGIAGIMTVSVRNNQNGYLRSQAVILANDMAAKMRANVSGLWEGAYNGAAPVAQATTCDASSPCDRTELAAYDMEQWGVALAQFLPSGLGSIECETPAAPSGIMLQGNWEASPPFSGICDIVITWNESNETGSDDQSLNLVVQP
jgi:type IV pilus assembly protein PilV